MRSARQTGEQATKRVKDAREKLRGAAQAADENLNINRHVNTKSLALAFAAGFASGFLQPSSRRISDEIQHLFERWMLLKLSGDR